MSIKNETGKSKLTQSYCWGLDQFQIRYRQAHAFWSTQNVETGIGNPLWETNSSRQLVCSKAPPRAVPRTPNELD